MADQNVLQLAGRSSFETTFCSDLGRFFVNLSLLALQTAIHAGELPVINDSEAVGYLGKSVEVRGLVVSVTTSPLGIAFINFGRDYPNQTFAGFIGPLRAPDWKRPNHRALWTVTDSKHIQTPGLNFCSPAGQRTRLGTLIDQIEHGHHVCRAYWNRLKKTSVRTPVSPRYLKVPQRNFKFLRSHSNRAAGLCLRPESRRDRLSEPIFETKALS